VRRAEERLAKGGTMAWAKHITGQDPNDLTSWDKFRSVAVIPGTSNRANGDARNDDELWVVVDRTIDGNDYTIIEQFQPLDWGPDDDYCWFVDCAGNGVTITGNVAVPEVPAVPATYGYTFVSDNGQVFGIPIGDVGLFTTFSGDANDTGGGIVGLPYASSPFVEGQAVVITGSDNYTGTYTLPAQNDPNEIQITDNYNAETFDGTERAYLAIGSLNASTGRIATDDDGYVYYGTNYSDSTYVTKIDVNDGTEDFTALTFDTLPAVPGSKTCMGLKISADSTDLYMSNQAYVYKFDLSDGSETWAIAGGEFDMDIDDSNNAYACVSNIVTQFATADGATTTYTLMGQSKHAKIWRNSAYDVHVDDTLGIVCWGGYQYYGGPTAEATPWLYNLAVRTFDDSAGDQVIVGDTREQQVVIWTITHTERIPVDYITSDGTNIYVLINANAGGNNIYKYSWDGSDLTLEDSSVGIDATSADGIFMDAWDNLVVVNNAAGGTTIYFYDPNDLSALGNVGGYLNNVADAWSGTGGIYTQGNAIANGDLGTASVPAVPGSGITWEIGDNGSLKDAYLCLYADGIPQGSFYATDDAIEDWNDTYTVIIAGINYYSIYETFPMIYKDQWIGGTGARKTSIERVRLDFYETMGCNFGVSLDEYSALEFSQDDFATAMDPYSGAKIVTFPRGITREPILHLWLWDPIPMGIRGMYPTMNVVIGDE
jgi:hypothetical protein